MPSSRLIARAGAPASALVVNSTGIQRVVSSGGEAGAPGKAGWRPDDAVHDYSELPKSPRGTA